jgi:hypothetical protein
MSLYYSFIDYKSPVPIIPRSPNGGLFTGKTANGPWGNYPVIPDAPVYTENLRSANPPPNFQFQAVSTVRPGNNPVNLPYHTMCETSQFNNLCANK